jgi:S-DNA-T family DNA segregation ATPase FtsK/SpoIIIE
VEVPIRKRQTVYFRRLLESLERSSFKLPVALGVNASYATYSFDLAELPHLLIAGTTGSGKSILVKSILASLMFSLTPNDVRLVMVDPKRVDFALFNDSPFLAREVVTDINMADSVLKTLVQEMENRYDLLEVNNAANISQFNDKAGAKNRIPYIVVVVDEFADLIMADKTDIADNIIRIAQKARACGIHLILATQRPSAEVISGLIKANVPGKIGLSVSSSINSKIIIDRPGAEKLLGKGDMIFISPELKEGLRLQGAFISDDEVKKFTRRSTRS